MEQDTVIDVVVVVVLVYVVAMYMYDPTVGQAMATYHIDASAFAVVVQL
jgi:hypothetical protein